MCRLLFLAVFAVAFLAGCEEGQVDDAVSPPGVGAVVSPLPTLTYSHRQLKEWHGVVVSDSPNWEGSLDHLEPATGYGLVTMTTVDAEAGRVVIGVNCKASVEPVRRAILDRVGVLGVPGNAVEVIVFSRVDALLLGDNRLEECQPSHPAGFGGYFLEGERGFYVYLLHPSPEAAEEVMAYQVGPDFPLDEWSVHPLQGDFTYAELADWYGRFLEDRRQLRLNGVAAKYLELVNVPGTAHDGPLHLSYAGIYPEKNRILFRIKPGPEAEAVRQVLEERLAALDVPSQAVIIDVQRSTP